MKFLMIAASFAALTFATACDSRDGPIEEAGEEIDQALGNEPTVGEQVEEAVEDAGDSLQEAGDNIEEAVDDTAAKIEESTPPPE